MDRLGSFWKLWAALGAWMAAYAIARLPAPLKSVQGVLMLY